MEQTRQSNKKFGETRGYRPRGGSTNQFDVNTACFAASHGDSAAVDRTLDRVAQRRPSNVLDRLAGHKTHLTQPRRDRIEAVDPEDLAGLAWQKLVESRHWREFLY